MEVQDVKEGDSPRFYSDVPMGRCTLLLPSRAARRAVATRYHAGQSSSQFSIHNALLVHAAIINTVMVAARRNAGFV